MINLGRQVISFFTECRGDWFHLSGAVGDCELDTVCMYGSVTLKHLKESV